MSWVNQYVGRQYTPQHNCYFWMAHIQRHIFRRHVPLDQPENISAMLQTSRQWVTVPVPEEGAVAFLSRIDEPHHIGVVAEAGVVHALEGFGVVYESFSRLRQDGWQILRYKVPR